MKLAPENASIPPSNSITPPFDGIGVYTSLVTAGTVVTYHPRLLIPDFNSHARNDVIQVADAVNQLRIQCLTGSVNAAVSQHSQFIPRQSFPSRAMITSRKRP